MKIRELKPNQSIVNLDAEVVSIGETKSFTRFGRVIRVANAKIKDDSGETSLTLWNTEIDEVKPNTKVRITNGFVKEFQGEVTVTAGKFGKIEVLDGEAKEGAEAEGAEEKEKEPEAEAEEKVEETEDEESSSQ